LKEVRIKRLFDESKPDRSMSLDDFYMIFKTALLGSFVSSLSFFKNTWQHSFQTFNDSF